MTKPFPLVSETDRRSRVLIIDDSIGARQVLRTILASASHEVAEALDGAAALNMVREDRFDIVVTDLEMPRMDGFEFIRALASLPAGVDRPQVVVHSARLDDPRVLARPELRHAQALVHKPASPETLLGVIDSVLNPDPVLIRLGNGP